MIPQQTDRHSAVRQVARSYLLFHFGTVGHTVSAAIVDSNVTT